MCVTGGAGQIAYSLLFAIASGDIFGKDQEVVLQLLDIPPAVEALGGVKMELEDCALPLLKGVVCTTDPKESFKNADVAILLGAMPRKQGMERKDLLKANATIFKEQGLAMHEVAKKDIKVPPQAAFPFPPQSWRDLTLYFFFGFPKVLVVGNPANTNAMIVSHYAKSIPKANFTALTRLDQNRAKSQIALKIGVSVHRVKNVIIWGNHSATQYPDVTHGFVLDYPEAGQKTPISAAVKDDAYLQGDFIKTIQQRGAAVIAARKLSSAMSAAKAIVDHVHDWWNGTPEVRVLLPPLKPLPDDQQSSSSSSSFFFFSSFQGEYVSMGVPSDGSYGIKEGVIFSYPVTTLKGTFKIVQGLSVSEFSRKMLDATADELYGEREDALTFLEQ